MDEAAFRQRLEATHPLLCPFAKALFAGCAGCALAGRLNLAEREIVVCREEAAQQHCRAMHDALRHNFGFAIREVHDDAAIPHAQEMRIQCGGLRGLSDVLCGDPAVADVAGLMRQLAGRWPDADDIPYAEVVRAARMLYKGRHG
ncbi:MAG: hypothetical protein AB1722_00635 [Pseudomonadota bacterium]